jgi:hypothetical protein
MTVTDNRNQLRWLQDPELTEWLQACRLDLIGRIGPQMPDNPRVRARVLSMATSMLEFANEHLEKLMRANESCATRHWQTG